MHVALANGSLRVAQFLLALPYVSQLLVPDKIGIPYVADAAAACVVSCALTVFQCVCFCLFVCLFVVVCLFVCLCGL